MNRRNLTAALLTLAIVSCLALAEDSTTRPAGPPLGAGGAAPPVNPATTSAPASGPEVEEIDLPPYYQIMAKETEIGRRLSDGISFRLDAHLTYLAGALRCGQVVDALKSSGRPVQVVGQRL